MSVPASVLLVWKWEVKGSQEIQSSFNQLFHSGSHGLTSVRCQTSPGGCRGPSMRADVCLPDTPVTRASLMHLKGRRMNTGA